MKKNLSCSHSARLSSSASRRVCMCAYSCSVLSNALPCHGLWSARPLGPRDFPGKNSGVGCHFLLQGIFLTQESNPCLLNLPHGQVDSLPLRHLGSASSYDGGFCMAEVLAPGNAQPFTLEQISQVVTETTLKPGGRTRRMELIVMRNCSVSTWFQEGETGYCRHILISV